MTMVVAENKSFEKAYDVMGRKKQKDLKKAYVAKGWSISLFYNDKSGYSNLTDERIKFYDEWSSANDVINFWD